MYSPRVHLASNTMNKSQIQRARPRRAFIKRIRGSMPQGTSNIVTSKVPVRPLRPINAPRTNKGYSEQNRKKYQHLSKCAIDYLCALEDPFNCIDDACVPMLPSTPSRKLKAFSKGTMVIGTAGVGYVIGYPTADNTITAISYSIGTYTGTTCQTAGVGNVNTTFNSDYTGAQFGIGLGLNQARLVGFGIRIMYTGTELNRSGDIRVLEETFHSSLVGYNSANFDAYDKSQKFQTSREWTSVTFHPVFPSDTQYSQSAAPSGAVPYLGIIVNSVAANTFDFEAYYIMEVVGSSARGKTTSSSDSVGVDAVLNIVQSKPRDGYQGKFQYERETTWVDKALNGLSSLAKIVPAMVQGIEMFAL